MLIAAIGLCVITLSVASPPAGRPLEGYWWWIALAILIIIALCFGFIRQRGFKPVQQALIRPAAGDSGEKPYAHLICTRGNFAGTIIPITGRLGIGRDPALCQLVFPAESHGIAMLHCEILGKEEGVTLIDKGSENGTFLADGRRLTPEEGVPLRNGDSFYLANTRNEFSLRIPLK